MILRRSVQYTCDWFDWQVWNEYDKLLCSNKKMVFYLQNFEWFKYESEIDKKKNSWFALALKSQWKKMLLVYTNLYLDFHYSFLTFKWPFAGYIDR